MDCSIKKRQKIYLIIESNPKSGYQKVVMISGNLNVIARIRERYSSTIFEYNIGTLQENYSGKYEWV